MYIYMHYINKPMCIYIYIYTYLCAPLQRSADWRLLPPRQAMG